METPTPNAGAAVLALSRATLAQLARDPATHIAVGLVGLGALTLHATTVFGFEAEARLRGELVRDSLLLGGAAVCTLGLLRVGGVEWRDRTAAPLVCSPLGRGGWFLGRTAGLLAAAVLAVGVVAVAAATMSLWGERSPGVILGALACAAIAGGAAWQAAQPASRAARACAWAGAAVGATAIGIAGLDLTTAALGAAAATLVLAVVGSTASGWLPLGGALGVVGMIYLLGHAPAPSSPLARIAWRCVVPDLAGVAAGRPAACAAAAAWTLGIAWLGGERARIHEV